MIFSLIVNQKTEAPKFVEKPSSSLKVLEDDPVTIRCKAHGKPAPNVVWYKDNTPIPDDNEHIVISMEQDGLEMESILNIPKSVLVEDDGKYTMEAVNDAGSVTHDVNLTGNNISHNNAVVTSCHEY